MTTRYVYVRAGFVAMPSSCTAPGSVTMPWRRVTPGALPSHARSASSYPPSRAWSPHVLPCSASPHRCTVGVPGSDSRSHLRSHHSSGSVAETVAMVASTTVSNVVGMTYTEAGQRANCSNESTMTDRNTLHLRYASPSQLGLSRFGGSWRSRRRTTAAGL
jgi:hypothetical protein